MPNRQIKNIALASLKATAAIVLFTGKAFLYICLALYVVGELLFSDYQSVPVAESKPVRTAAKTIAQPTVLAIELPAVEQDIEPSDAEKEGIAIAAAACHYAKLTAVQLRKECSALGIKWRNAHAPSKHLSKSEMLQALAA